MVRLVSVFMVNVPFAAAALLLGIRYVPESRDPRPGSFDLPGAALSTAGFSLLVYAIIEAPGQGWTSGLILGLLAASVVLLGAFLWWERHIDEPMLDLGFFRSASFSVGTAAVSAAFFALLGAIFALTQYLQFVHGYSAIGAGAIMSPIALGLMMGAGSSSKAAERLGGSRVVAAGLTGLATMLALTTLWEPQTGALTLALWFFVWGTLIRFCLQIRTSRAIDVTFLHFAGTNTPQCRLPQPGRRRVLSLYIGGDSEMIDDRGAERARPGASTCIGRDTRMP